MFILQTVFTLAGAYVIALHMLGANTTYAQRLGIVRMLHKVEVSDPDALTHRANLRRFQALSIDPRYPFYHQTREICDELGLELLGDYEGTSLDSLCQMCASGLGLAILPELYLRSDVGGKNVVAPLRIHDWSGTRSVAALWRKGSVYGENYREIAMVIQREARLLLGDKIGS